MRTILLLIVVLATAWLPSTAGAQDAKAEALNSAIGDVEAELAARRSWAGSIPAATEVRRRGNSLMVGIGVPLPPDSTKWKDWWTHMACHVPQLRKMLLLDGGLLVYTDGPGKQRLFLAKADCYAGFPGWNSKEAESVRPATSVPGYEVMPAGARPKDKQGAAPAASVPIEARLASCDPAVVRAAAQEMFRDPGTLREPLMLFHAASGERNAGRKEEAAFFYLAARLRTSRQLLFEKGDRGQLLSIMAMTVGPMVMPVLEAEPELARRVVERVIEWDRSTPDAFRDRAQAQGGEVRDKLAEIDAGLARLPGQILGDPARAAKAREVDAQADRQLQEAYAARCGPGTLDAVDAAAAIERIKSEAEALVRTHRLVLRRAGGSIKSVSVGAWRQTPSGLPSRMTVSVYPAEGKTFFAEVDAETAITADRKLGSVELSLACLTDLWIGQRMASWNDVCISDPNALRLSGRAAGRD